jgi:hypothetical protein
MSNYDILPKSIITVPRQNTKKNIRGKNHKWEGHSTRSSFSPFNIPIGDFAVKYYLKDCTQLYDPWAGWGERHKIAKDNNIPYFGYDISPTAIEFACKNFDVSNNLGNSITDPIPDFDGLITCPPYFNLERYDGEKKDGQISKCRKWEEFLKLYRHTWLRAIGKAKSGTTFVVQVGNWRKKHKFYDLEYETQKIFMDCNMKIFDKIILSHDGNVNVPMQLPQCKRLGYVVKIHQTLLVFKKP